MPVVDRSGVLRRIEGRKLDIGCGPRKVDDDHIGVDLLDYPGVDVVGDIREVLATIPDGALSGIYSSHFLEHVEDVPGLVAELARVLRPGAVLVVVVPHFSNPYFYSDTTHKTAFGLYSFSYLARDGVYRRQVPSYSRDERLALRSARLRFKSPPPFYARYAFKRGVELLVNANRWTQELYEENLCYLVPCYDVRFELVRLGGRVKE
jgi:SAM-dependent methyltransferase